MQFIQAFLNPFSQSLLSQSSKTAQGVRCGKAVGRGRIVKQLASWDGRLVYRCHVSISCDMHVLSHPCLVICMQSLDSLYACNVP
mmetsp:Transcript_46599/g.75021  ORF Transcript_46599/g.75021 Transcript_46599/m.75021 type:complete len:85 (-) Transcript_46599:1549-1803(-)